MVLRMAYGNCVAFCYAKSSHYNYCKSRAYDNYVAFSYALPLTTQNPHLLRQWLVVIVLHFAISVLYQVKNAGLTSAFCFAFC